MSLIVYTARISTRDPDRFDVTRKSGGAEGEPFAPSWNILRPALNARAEAQKLVRFAEHPNLAGFLLDAYRVKASDIERRAWDAYVPAYLAEMRESYRRHPAAWRRLLARERVVLVCYCVPNASGGLRCHRTLLADILGKLGADVRGEIPVDFARPMEVPSHPAAHGRAAAATPHFGEAGVTAAAEDTDASRATTSRASACRVGASHGGPGAPVAPDKTTSGRVPLRGRTEA